MESLQDRIHSCRACGKKFGQNATGFGVDKNPKWFFIGLNPHVTHSHTFVIGRGLTHLLDHLKEIKFTDFYFDNVIKCQIPNKGKPKIEYGWACKEFLSEQIQIINPERLMIFGSIACEVLGVPYRSFLPTYRVFNKPAIAAPHFSWPFYTNSQAIIQRYYKNLDKVIGG